MRQLKALVWKHWLWCRQHPLKLFTMYALPWLLCLFLPLSYQVLTLDNVPNCDYHSWALPPSHVLFTIQSVLCGEVYDCTFDKPGYQPATNFTHSFFETMPVNGSRFCPGMTDEQFKERMGIVMFNTCVDRKFGYERMTTVDYLFRGHILFTPNNTETQMYIDMIVEHFKEVGGYKMGYAAENYTDDDPILQGLFEAGKMSLCFKPINDRIHSFANRDDALTWTKSRKMSTDAIWGLIEFTNTSNQFEYNLITHYNQRVKPSTLLLQSLIDSLIIRNKTNTTNSPQLQYKMLPKRCAKDTKVYVVVLVVVQYLATMGVAYVAYIIASEMCYEKETGLDEFLLISNVSRWKIRLTWVVFAFILIWTVLVDGSVTFYWWDTRVIEHSSLTLILALITIYTGNIVSGCFLVTAMCKTATGAGMTTFMLLLVALLIPGWAQFIPNVGYNGGKLFMLRVMCWALSPAAAQIAMCYVFAFEHRGRGVTWSNAASSPADGDEFGGLLEVMMIMVCQTVLYTILTAYTNSNAKGDGLIRRIMRLIKGDHSLPVSDGNEPAANHNEEEHVQLQRLVSADIEKIHNEKPIGIAIENLTKDYGNTPKPAVDSLNVHFYQGEITAMLGHNGAGKSTTMNILTGMLRPTSGSATVQGHDILTQINTIRLSMSYCPQHNIIYPHMNFVEHLQFFGEMRGLDKDEISSYINKVADQMEISQNDRHMPAEKLSGGTKRKLSICIAFLGQPSTVILDEPTSAIDAYSRRTIWDMLLNYKGRSTILISTHNMLEADLVADRICIIDHGRLKCAGTSMYLKQRYGDGSVLSLAHDRPIANSDTLLREIRHFVPDTRVQSSGVSETKYAIPASNVLPQKMSELCAFLEEQRLTWGIRSFGVSESTMNQVFFKVTLEDVDSPAAAEDTNDLGDVPKGMNGNNNEALITSGTSSKSSHNHVIGVEQSLLEQSTTTVNTASKLDDKVINPGCVLLQAEAVIVKRWHLMRSSWAGLFYQILLPAIMTIVLLLFNNLVAEKVPKSDKMFINPWNTSIAVNEFFYSGMQDEFTSTLMTSGLGSKCGSVSSTKCGFNGTSTEWPDAADTVIESRLACQCSVCPLGADAPEPPSSLLPTGDRLLNLNNRNVTEWLLRTNLRNIVGGITRSTTTTGDASPLTQAVTNMFWQISTDGTLERLMEMMPSTPAPPTTTTPADYEYEFDLFGFGGGASNSMFSDFKMPAWMDFKKGGLLYVDTIWSGMITVNRDHPTPREKDMLMMPPAVLNSYSNLRLRTMATPEHSIHSYTEEAQMTADVNLQQLFEGVLLGSFSSLALTFPALYILLVIVNEASNGNRQLQYVHGLKAWVYWLTNFIWDLAAYTLSILLMLLIILLYPSTFTMQIDLFFLIAFIFAVQMILFAYVLSFVFDTGRSAVMIVGILGPFVSLAATILIFFRNKDWFPTANIFGNLFPMFFVTDGCQVAQILKYMPGEPNAFDWDYLGKRTTMAALFIAIMIVVLVIGELRILCRVYSWYVHGTSSIEAPPVTADDIRRESLNVAQHSQEYVFRAEHVLKKYGRNEKPAVDGVTFGVKAGECFGLLGVNGAGKTSLFRMITGYTTSGHGSMHVMNHNVIHTDAVSKHISYCPQEDILFDQLTVTEHLLMYARIRGILAGQRASIVDSLMKRVGIAVHANKKPAQLSGGNKRKLNFAISLLNQPSCIFLDEMTTGLDPRARQDAWNCLNEAVNAGSAVVITSHSIEECEALCHRLGIMVNGELLCVGGVQYLKDKFGNKYHIKLRVTGGQSNVDAVLARVQSQFADCHIAEQHINYAEVDVPATPSLRLSAIFAVIHDLMNETQACVTDFSVSQTTLEQVFVNMVKHQD